MRALFATITALSVLLIAAPAHATRDPFRPAVTQGSTVTNPSSSNPGANPSSNGNNVSQPTAPRGLPNTGADPSPWLAIAYVLLAGGAAAIVIARLYARVPTHAPR